MSDNSGEKSEKSEKVTPQGGGPLPGTLVCHSKRPPRVGDHFPGPQCATENGPPGWGTTSQGLSVPQKTAPQGG